MYNNPHSISVKQKGRKMCSISRKKAEEHLASLQKAKKGNLTENEERTLEIRQNIVRLKALRLAKQDG